MRRLNTTTSSSSSLVVPWHSPVPYLFGGLAVMLGLIAFALFILACSYWKLSGFLESDAGNNERDPEKGDSVGDELEEKIAVIMAGNNRSTFLATPAIASTTKKTVSVCLGDDNCKENSCHNVQYHDKSDRSIGKPGPPN